MDLVIDEGPLPVITPEEADAVAQLRRVLIVFMHRRGLSFCQLVGVLELVLHPPTRAIADHLVSKEIAEGKTQKEPPQQ